MKSRSWEEGERLGKEAVNWRKNVQKENKENTKRMKKRIDEEGRKKG